MQQSTLRILKIGGAILDHLEAFESVCQQFANWAHPKILVHGGGGRASQLLEQLNIVPQMHSGRRITDDDTLEVVTMVYAGLLNKKVVGHLQSLGCDALGLSGADLDSIRAHKRVVKDVDYGWAGDIDTINTPTLSALLSLNIVPVFCAITHNGNGQLLNTNADTIAATLGTAFADHYEVELHYCFDRPGVLLDKNDDDSVISELTHQVYEDYKNQGIIEDGMLPKLSNAFDSLSQGVKAVHLGGAFNLGKGTIIK
ncbi:MAG: acetylglutamate kinase [Bacteroidota bacterium]